MKGRVAVAHNCLFSRRAARSLVTVMAIASASATVFANGEPPQIGMLYWVGGNQLSRANVDGSEYQVLLSNLDAPDGLTVDLLSDVVYWTNMGRGPNGSLQRARLDGSPVAAGEDYLVPVGHFETGKEVEFDPVADKLYWADRDGKHVMRSNTDGSVVESVLHKFGNGEGTIIPLENPVGIALDLERRQVYITDRFMGTIMRFGMDMPVGDNNESRSDVEILVEPRSSEDRPIDIDLDLENGLMYWTDRGVHQILRANLDGSDIHVLIDSNKVPIEDPIGISLDLTNGKFYWSDMTTHKIHRANLDGSAIEEIIGGEEILNGVPYGPLGVQYKALEPESGSAEGGETVAVLGSHFVAGKTNVQLGNHSPVPAHVLSQNLLTFTTAPAQPGRVAVKITTPHGQAVLEGAYTYR